MVTPRAGEPLPDAATDLPAFSGSLVTDMGNVGVRPLTICAIGAGSSTHTAARLRWFAERGHRVFLITTSPSPSGIPGVVEVDLNAEPLVWLRLRRTFRGVVHRSLTAMAFLQTRVRRNPERGRRVGGPATSPDPSGIPDGKEAAANAQLQVSREASLRFPRPFHAVVHRVLTAKAFLHALRQCKPDVIHVHYAYGYYPWLTGLFGCRPLVVTVEGGDVLFDEQGSPTTVGKWLTVRLLRQADYVTTQSNFLGNAVNRLGDFRGKTERVLWGVSLDEFSRRDASALRLDLGLRPEARVILSPKILQPFYRVNLVVEAMAIVRPHCPDAVLVVTEYAADPAYREQLATLVTDLDLDEHVTFVGVSAHDEMADYYSLAELSIAVPPSDGLPQTLLESLACGTPHILNRLPRYEEIVQHEESTYLVDPTPESIAAGIIRLLDDAELRAMIAEQGRRIVEQQANIDQQAARVESRYRELVATMRPRTIRLSALLSAVPAYASFRRSA